MKIGGAAAISGGAIALLVSTFVLSTGTGASACTPGTVNIDAVAKVTDSIDGYAGDQLTNAAQMPSASFNRTAAGDPPTNARTPPPLRSCSSPTSK